MIIRHARANPTAPAVALVLLAVVPFISGCTGDGSGFGDALVNGARAGLIEGLGGPQQSNPYLSGNAGSGTSSTQSGLEPIGNTEAAGCSGIQIVAYNRTALEANSKLYSVELKNSGRSRKTIEIFVERQNVPQADLVATLHIMVSPGQTRSLELARSSQAPKTVRVITCA